MLKEKLRVSIAAGVEQRVQHHTAYVCQWGSTDVIPRVMQSVNLEDSLAEEVLSGRIKDGDEAEVDVEDGKVVVKHLNRATTETPELASAGR